MKLSEIEKKYITAYKSQSTILEDIFKKSLENTSIDLGSFEISQCLIQRLAAYYQTQDEIKKLLNKKYAAPAADFFVESVLFFLNLVLKKGNSSLEVYSERQIKTKKNAIRPDISIWKDNDVIAIIECKTQLGWNRSKWEEDFIKRERKLKRSFPVANAYLLVMTGKNWNGFNKEQLTDSRYYCILKDKWPTEIDPNSIYGEILTPVEDLFRVILGYG